MTFQEGPDTALSRIQADLKDCLAISQMPRMPENYAPELQLEAIRQIESKTEKINRYCIEAIKEFQGK